jgi:hypothetical protein
MIGNVESATATITLSLILKIEPIVSVRANDLIPTIAPRASNYIWKKFFFVCAPFTLPIFTPSIQITEFLKYRVEDGAGIGVEETGLIGRISQQILLVIEWHMVAQ